MSASTDAPTPSPSLDAAVVPSPLGGTSRLLARLLIVLGGTVIVGWLGRWPALTHLVPGLTGMVMQTAVDFVLLGAALLMPRWPDHRQPVVLLPALLLLALATLNLAQIATGLELGINLRGAHDWIVDDNPRPGQQALSTSLSFLMAALSLLVLTVMRGPSLRAITLGRWSAALLFLIALAALVGYALRIEWLLTWYALSKMALHTAAGFLVAAIALWWRWDALDRRDGAEARELRIFVKLALVLTAVLASVMAVAVFRHEGERALDSSLSVARSSMAEGIESLLHLRSTRAAMITTRPILLEGIRQLSVVPNDPATLASARAHIDGFSPYGFSYIALLDAAGQPLVEVGTAAHPTDPVVALHALPGGEASLRTEGGFLLRHRHVIDAGADARGILVTEQPLPELSAILSSDQQLGSSARSQLCSVNSSPACADGQGRRVPTPADLSVVVQRMSSAIDHRKSTAGDHLLSSWQPIGDTGLLVGLSLDSADLYSPIRRGLLWGFLLVGVFTVVAVLLVRSRIVPLVQRLARSESWYVAVFEAVSDGLMLVDRDGQVLAINRAAGRILGVAPEALQGRRVSDVDWQVLDEQGQPVAVADYPATRVLAGDGQPLTQVLSIARPDGQRRWLMVDASMAPGPVDQVQVCAVMAFSDITERRRDERRLAESQRFQRALLDAAPYAVIASDTAFNCIEFNPAAERMLWYRADEMVGKVVPPMIHDPQEVTVRAAELSQELGRPVAPGPDVFVLKAHDGIVEEREWTYIRKDGSRFPVNLAITEMRDEQGEPTGYLGIAYDITERKRREDYTRHVAHHDFLTGLPNRMLLHDRLGLAIESARRHGTRLAVVLLDLDHFKRVNDTLGHQVGDLLLAEVARRLQQAVRASDTVARLGGDEFVLLLPDVEASDEALAALAGKIVAAVSQPMQLHGHPLVATPSMGLAWYPEHGETGEALLKHADIALYRTKAAGRAGFRLFDRTMVNADGLRTAPDAPT